MYKSSCVSYYKYIASYVYTIIVNLTLMISATSSSDNSDTSVFPWVIFGSPLGPVSEHKTLIFRSLICTVRYLAVP